MWSEANIRNQYPSIVSEVFPSFFLLSVDICNSYLESCQSSLCKLCLSDLLCKFCYLRNCLFWYNFPAVYTARSDMQYLPSSAVPVNVTYQRHQPSCSCHQVITSVNRCNMQHYVIQGWTAGGRFRTVAGACCIVCGGGTWFEYVYIYIPRRLWKP